MKRGLIFSSWVVGFLASACGGGSGGEKESPRDRALSAYTERHAEEHCQAEGQDEDESGGGRARGDFVLLDAAPTCDLSRFSESDETSAPLTIEKQSLEGVDTFALCACGGLEASNKIQAPGESDIIGDIGVNETAFGSAPLRLDGQLVVGEGARFDNVFEARELYVDGVLTAANEVNISGDATVGGLDIPGERVSVGGTLTVPKGTDLSSVETSEEVVEKDVDVEPPCDCAEDLDYSALRKEFRDPDGDGQDDYDEPHQDWEDDDPFAVENPADLLADLDEDRTVYLACGTYYLSEITSSAALTLIAVGDVEVFVDGDVRVAGPLTIFPQESASLDLFVNGTFNPTNRVELGVAKEPDALRLYVREKMRFAGPTALHGTVYAPRAAFIANNTLTSDGAIFAERFDFAGPVQITDGPRFTSDACLVWDELDENLRGDDESNDVEEEVADE